MSDLFARVAFAVRRPDLTLRRLAGKPTIEIELDEINRYVPLPAVILEAGAADGSDTARMAAYWPGAHIYAFEPVPSAFARLVTNTIDSSNVTRLPVALSAETGQSEMHISSFASGEDNTDSSSLLAPSGHLTAMPGIAFDERLTVETTTLDVWRAESGVGTVDLIWLDLQGMEMSVLRSSPETVERTRAILLEVSRIELYDRSDLYPQVLHWMKSQGFRLVIDRVSRLFGNALFVR